MVLMHCEIPPSQGEVPTWGPNPPKWAQAPSSPSTGQTKALPAHEPSGERSHRFHRCSAMRELGGLRGPRASLPHGLSHKTPEQRDSPLSPETPLAVLSQQQQSAATAVSRRVAVATQDPAPRVTVSGTATRPVTPLVPRPPARAGQGRRAGILTHGQGRQQRCRQPETPRVSSGAATSPRAVLVWWRQNPA